ncbi:MAG: S-adenosylmethionine:tRNA ribosyltransferase-isomerase [Prevotellaceae bacterium]|nr:S-adenosylmethionine:tRNA ribosyltransferase-isomerase [Prevotellaceae bacterium]
MTNAKDISIKDYDYPLGEERIAKFPLKERDKSRLLVYDGSISEDIFSSLPKHLPKGALMVFNNTKVIQARLRFRKETGAVVEVFLLEPLTPADYVESFARQGQCEWLCLVGNLKRWKAGTLSLALAGQETELRATRLEERGDAHRILFQWTGRQSWAEVLEQAGELPIPPYLNRKTEESDKTTYQTVYSKMEGSVAAPTAGLHFSQAVLREIDERGIDREEVTLHVGAGTFKPVKSQTIGEHEMHSEHIAVGRQTVEKLLSHGGQAIAVGTTSVRTLESLYYMGLRARQLMDRAADTGDAEELATEQWEPYCQPSPYPMPSTCEALRLLLIYMDKHKLQTLHSATRIIIAPGYTYHIVNQMLTNFHQPQSTLLLLVSAFVGDDWRRVYDYALRQGFRFLSYGDCCLLSPSRL